MDCCCARFLSKFQYRCADVCQFSSLSTNLRTTTTNNNTAESRTSVRWMPPSGRQHSHVFHVSCYQSCFGLGVGCGQRQRQRQPHLHPQIVGLANHHKHRKKTTKTRQKRNKRRTKPKPHTLTESNLTRMVKTLTLASQSNTAHTHTLHQLSLAQLKLAPGMMSDMKVRSPQELKTASGAWTIVAQHVEAQRHDTPIQKQRQRCNPRCRPSGVITTSAVHISSRTAN